MLGGYVARGYRTGALLVEPQLGDVARVHANGDQLEIEQNVDDVLLDALDGRVFVQYTLDRHFRDRGSRQGGQQNTAQRITERMTETAFERFDDNTRMAGGHGMYLDDPW